MKTIIRKRLFCIVLACCFLQLCLPLQQIGGFVTTVFAAEEENVYDFAGGTGTAENPYKVETMFHLNNVRHYLDAHFIQMNDIDLTEATADNGILGAWQSIGTSSDEFTGSYDGGENVIKGLQGKSLFEYIGENGVVQNLGMVDGNVNSFDGSSAGGIAKSNYGTISNCYNTGNVTATSYWNCYDSGGIAGSNYGTISNCYNIGNIASLSYSHYSGGIAGSNYGTISNCYNTGNVTAKCDSSGGIAGKNNGTISNCYNTGNVTSSHYSGGIAGSNYGTISNCYSTGNVTATSKSDTAYVGGLVGSTSKGKISTGYSIGEVSATGATTRVGKVIGMNNGTTLSHLYYIGTSSDFGVGNEGNGKDRVEFRTAEQMKTPSSLTGFDFETVWAVDEDINNGFPYLQGVGVVTPPIEQPKNELERSINNLSYDSDKQAYTFTVEFTNNTDSVITINVFAAAYDDSGRMTGLTVYDLTDLAAGSGTTIDAVIPAPQTAAYIKVICMDSNTLAPVGAALKEEV